MTDPDTTRWRQVTWWCADWQAAEQTAVDHLGPALAQAQDAELISSWWFVRKGPSWRLRILPAHGQDAQTTVLVEDLLRDLADRGAVQRWAPAVYEPETHAFGGAAGIQIAHDLFHADSRHLLRHLRSSGGGHRREVGLLLAGLLLRAAGLDWYEQGDVWARLAAHRLTTPPPVGDLPIAAVRSLVTARAHAPHSPLTTSPDWPAAFQHTGQRLAGLAQRGELTRGLRAVLAHHLLFAWNRAGIPGRQQALLAATAAHIVFHQPPVHTPELIGHLAEPTRIGSLR